MSTITAAQRETAARTIYETERDAHPTPQHWPIWPGPDGEVRDLYLPRADAVLAALGITVSDEPDCPAHVWIGQASPSCDDCGRPYWKHTHRKGHGDEAGRLVPITPADAARSKARWAPEASDEPETPDAVIERARATVERSMGRAWTDEGEYTNLPQQAAHDLAAAGLLRTEPDDAAERVRHILSSGYGCVTCAVDDLRSAVGLPTADAEHEHGPDDPAERIAQAIEVEMRRHDHAQVGFSAIGDAYAHAARIAREVGEAGR